VGEGHTVTQSDTAETPEGEDRERREALEREVRWGCGMWDVVEKIDYLVIGHLLLLAIGPNVLFPFLSVDVVGILSQITQAT
jgi:hypothetical protein